MINLFITALMLLSISKSAKISPKLWDCDSPKVVCDQNTCLPLNLCPELIKAVGNITINSRANEIPEKYLCKTNNQNYPCVCCPFPKDEVSPTTPAPVEAGIDKNHLLPESYQCCDLPVPYVFGGKPIIETEFPSLALLHYVDSNGKSSFPCAGSLISKRYVITAAHCVIGEILVKAGKLRAIRLGEHDLSDTGCENGKCNDGVQEFKIEKIIIHKKYEEKQKPHDITLIRLATPVSEFTRNISPICLRWVHNTPTPAIESNHKFTAVGWGQTLPNEQRKIANKVTLPHFDLNRCAEIYKTYRTNITEKQICAGGEFKKDTCGGDSGGPLITKINACNYLDGIVSFGKGCGLENRPGVYTNVTAYRDWIMRVIEP